MEYKKDYIFLKVLNLAALHIFFKTISCTTTELCQLLLMQPLFFSALPSSQIKTKQRAGRSKQTFSIILPEYNRRIAQCILQTNTTDFNPEGSGSSVQGSLNPGCSRLVFWKCKHCWALLWIPPSLPMDWRFLSCRELSAKSVHHWIFGGINGISVDSVVDSDRTVDDASKPRSEIRQRVISNNRQWRRKRPFGKIESALELLLLPHSYLWIMCKQGKIRFFISKSSWKRHLSDGPRRTTAWLVYLLLIWTFSFLRDHFIYTRCSKKSKILCLYIWCAISESISLYPFTKFNAKKVPTYTSHVQRQ